MNEALAAALARSGGEIVVTGHTDTVGSGARNDELSRRRAQQVRQLFVAAQFPAGRASRPSAAASATWRDPDGRRGRRSRATGA